MLQGFLFSMPVTAERIDQLLVSGEPIRGIT
jgi:EAL domain-containing protein (putative c-di-GMP-specific phosphodiesterase class I)